LGIKFGITKKDFDTLVPVAEPNSKLEEIIVAYNKKEYPFVSQIENLED